ncbi:MAG: DUF1512 family protein [Candidatus Aenigmatarchaeota archaeon]
MFYQIGEIGIGNIISFILLIIFFFFYSKIIVWQMLWRLEESAKLLRNLTLKGKKIVIKKISKKPRKDLKDKINNFLEFFVIEPVSLDPFGIIKKIEHIVMLQEKRFKYFVKTIAPNLDSEEQANVLMGLSATMSLNQISKIVRHYVETIRKTKNLQLAFLLQMYVPTLEKLAKALLSGTESLTNGWPIGDGIGSLVVAHLIGNAKVKEIEEDTVVAKRKIFGRDVFLIKARGPGGRLGRLGKAVEKIVRKERISKIITIDASLKLEGEKTGGIAEGIGVAIGGIGIDKSYIENIAVKKNIPLDSIVIKMSQEEAVQPMKKEIVASIKKVIGLIEDNIRRTKGKIIVVGVGNSSGIGNDKHKAEEAEKTIKKVLNILKKREEKKRRGLLSYLKGVFSKF